ncbi:PEP-CTERM sorting domain-containing protein [Paucibacter sp. R3-3]|uniref:PEP-CTERM sorting domain-containing protein n=1 Tax=Roseateles agri TaxID=3098619 RepID=A0ABU5DJC6_9BURK|nr:PEP-CTERM sorting domain-containing protein [Paucibacter sp. R3-3]MDY0746396.1 PEP-CTERM sorting domain-containing protein [Paucibacter sp. R3-3]
MKHRVSRVLAAAAIALGATSAFAQDYGSYVDHQADYLSALAASGAAVTNNAWVNVTSFTNAAGVPGLTGTGGFPGTTAWSGKASQVDTSSGNVGTSLGGATLSKISNAAGNAGGAYAASGSIYFGGFSADVNNNGGQLAVADSTPLAGLQSVVFQVGIGEAWTYDFFNHALPTLSYTTAAGTTSNIAATFSEVVDKFDNGTVEMPTGTENVYINQYALQWDLSGVSDPITSFSVSFNGVMHSQVYGLTLTESSDFLQVVAATPVPEPETYALLATGLIGVAFIARRRRAAANA